MQQKPECASKGAKPNDIDKATRKEKLNDKAKKGTNSPRPKPHNQSRDLLEGGGQGTGRRDTGRLGPGEATLRAARPEQMSGGTSAQRAEGTAQERSVEPGLRPSIRSAQGAEEPP